MKDANVQQYRLVLLNDETHSYGYVVALLREIFGYDEHMAFELTKAVDQEGRAVVYTGPYEHAEFKRDKVLDFGPDLQMPISSGSMNCELEPVS